MDRYGDYFNTLKLHHKELYSGGSDLNPIKTEISNNIVNSDYHGNLHFSDTQHSNQRRNNDKVGGIELLDRLEPILPISSYYGKNINPELQQHLKDANKKQVEKDRLQLEKDKENALLFSQGFGVNPQTGKSTRPEHSLHHNNNHTSTIVNTRKGVDTTDQLLQDLINSGVATVHTQQHKIHPKSIIQKGKNPINQTPIRTLDKNLAGGNMPSVGTVNNNSSGDLPPPPPPPTDGIVM